MTIDRVDIRKSEVIQLLKQINVPILNNNLVSLGMVRNLRIIDDYVYLRLYLGSCELDLKEEVRTKLSQLGWCKKTYIEIRTISQVRRTIGISSGKGGVGKSTVAVNLAAALSLTGAKVGLLDADVYGPNIPQMMGLGHSEIIVTDTADGQRFIPLEAHGIKLMSVGLLAEPDHPLAWRGPVLHKIINQFIHQVEWGEMDYLLIDLPPGTGDAQITIVQESPICGVILVTTPQQVAIADVRRSVYMFRQVGVPVLGIIENMSYLLNENVDSFQAPQYIFGKDGGKLLSEELEAPLLGQIPIHQRICESGDRGLPIVLGDRHFLPSRILEQIAQGLRKTFNNL
ncbi:Mrp/NBP35 family ATP-binding protein [Cylindrospermopsis raciborskii]|uniref:Mrp/NBP35 family ATP-binding protein n=1 Tax=Cylindrospermopsis raciborskii TaxID=77022 RepID=UPI001BAA0E9E|nr:Mrp/NBP35 family ATP-binding protein [Cylindrospermopsis raciborskii]